MFMSPWIDPGRKQMPSCPLGIPDITDSRVHSGHHRHVTHHHKLLLNIISYRHTILDTSVSLTHTQSETI